MSGLFQAASGVYMITIIVGNTKCKVVGLTDPKIIKELDTQMSYTIQGFNFMNRYNNWDGRHRLFTKNHYFPIGLLSMAKSILEKHKCSYQIKDNREPIVYGTPLTISPKSKFSPRDYQTDVVNLAWQQGGGIIKMATGAGKSLVIAMLAAKYNIKTVIYVIGIELLYQMRDTIQKAYPKLKVGVVGDGNCDIQNITIATIWSAANAFGEKADILDSDLTPFSKQKDKESVANKNKIKDMIRGAELIIVDECQYCGSATVQLLHRESISAKHRFLLSASPWREAGDDILIESVGGPKIYDLPASKLIDQGWLVPPKIYFLNVPAKKQLGNTYLEVYKNFVVYNDERNDLIVKAAKKLITEGRKVLILVTQVSHGKRLLSLLEKDLRACSLDGTNKSEARLQAIQDMENGNLDVLVASKIFDQGIDIPSLDALILAGSGKSSGRALQRIGRVIRKGKDGSNKKDAIVVDFLDNCRYLKKHSQIRRDIYTTEPKFKIIMPKK